VTATCLHPATYMPTKIVASPVSTLAEGVDATLRLAVDPAMQGVSGTYFNGTRESEADPQAYDAGAGSRAAARRRHGCLRPRRRGGHAGGDRRDP